MSSFPVLCSTVYCIYSIQQRAEANIEGQKRPTRGGCTRDCPVDCANIGQTYTVNTYAHYHDLTATASGGNHACLFWL